MTALVVGCIVVVVLAGVGVLGVLLADDQWQRERERKAARDARIDAQWRTMQANQRIHLAFWIARRRMEQEAERERREYRS